MTENGKLEAIWLKRVRGGPMAAQEQVELKANKGLVGNANQGGKRQVTIIEKEVWESVMTELGASANPAARRANLMVSGVRLAETGGQILHIGGCRIRIFGETKPCKHLEEVHPGLKEAMAPNWQGGAFGEILDDGEIAVGDDVRWAEA